MSNDPNDHTILAPPQANLYYPYCNCSKKAQEYHADPRRWASPYCNIHHLIWKNKWMEVANKAESNLRDCYHLRVTFAKLYEKDIVSKILPSFLKRVQYLYPNIQIFGRLHFTAEAGLHFNAAIASPTPIDRDLIASKWRLTHFKITDDYPPVSEYLMEQKKSWEANCWYMLGGGRMPKDSQLPPRGIYPQLVRHVGLRKKLKAL